MALTRVTSGGIAPGVEIKFDQNDSPTAPAISFDTDPDTGIYSPAANTIAISTGGVKRFEIGPDGEISLGDPNGGVTTGFLPVTNSAGSNGEVPTGKTIYVNINDSKADDGIANNGENLNRPFRTLERALIEAARKSYVPGIGQTAGDAGADLFEYFTIVVYPGQYAIDNRPGVFAGTAPEWDGDYSSAIAEDAITAGDYYKFNAKEGGVIVPRGTSIIGLDLRKTVIRPKYLPDPVSLSTNESAIFRLTGGCYIWQITFKDAVSQPYSTQSSFHVNGNLSHHKLTVFKYADSADLNSYYRKIDQLDGNIPESGTSIFELYRRTEENRIVGNFSDKTTVDTVASASPYVFNCSVRSEWGLNGLHADGARATGFKSMVIAQYTAISLQKDDRAFVGSSLGGGPVQTNPQGVEYSLDPGSKYRDDWRHYHIKASNDAFLQVVSVFAVGNADHFLAETGGDMSITNSNSNFGNTALRCVSHKPQAFTQDSGGYVVGVVPPRGINPNNDNLIGVSEVDVGHTIDAYDAVANADKAKFKKVYITINGQSEIAESDIPEYYIKDSSGTVVKSELLVDGLNYSLGKREYSDGLPEAIYANLSKTPADPTNELYAARLRQRDATNTVDPKVSYTLTGGGAYTTKNDIRSYYAWEYTQTNLDGVHLGRVCILVDDTRAAASLNITGIPTGFTISSNSGNEYPDKAAGDYNITATVTNPASPTTQSNPIEVIATINGDGNITAVKPLSDGGSPGTPGTLSGSGFSVGNQLTLFDGVGTSLGTRIGAGPMVITVSSVGSLTGVSYTADNIKPEGYLTNSSVGARYAPFDSSTSLESQPSKNLSLLRRLTQKIDSNADGQTSLTDNYEFTSNTTTTAQIKRIQDNRQSSGSGELLWRVIYKLPSTDGIKRKPPESRFTVQLRDNNASYPFTYNGTNTGSKSFYIYNVETLIDYKFGERDGYYLLTLLDGNITEKSDGSSFANTISYGVQTIAGSTYNVSETTVTSWGVSQNINYLYPEIDLDNPKWNPKPSLSKYREDIGNTIAMDTTLESDGYDRITQYSVTAESVKDFANDVLSGGTIAGTLTNELNLTTYFGISKLTDSKMMSPYSTGSFNEYGVDNGVVTEFVDDVPVFSNRCILFGNNVTTSATAGTPVNLHRPTIIRASGHTWEYIGFGPGNYSTALPRFQTEILTPQAQVNAQGLESGGGFIASSGTNSQGDFFIGNQVIDTKGNQSNTLNFPRVKTSADNKLIDFADPASLSSNSASSSFNPSSFSATLTQSLASLQAAQQNSFKTANLEATSSTIGTLKINTKIDIASNVFTNTSNFPAANQNSFGFVKRAVDNWYSIDAASADFAALSNSYISPVDLYDWANKNAFITTVPTTWPLLSSQIPAAGTFNAVSNAGEVSDTQSLQLTSNFTFQPYSPEDTRWYNASTGVTAAVLGGVDNLVDYEGRSGQILLIYDNNVKLGALYPSAVWKPVTDTFRGIDAVSGNPVNYLTSQYFLVTYYVTNGKVVYAVNSVDL